MARWTVAGSIGAIGGPLLLAAAAWAGLGWRGLFAAFARVDARRRPPSARRPAGGTDGERLRVRDALRAITRREVLRWLLLLELADLLLDVFVGFLALYLVDEAGASHATAGPRRRAVGGRRARGLGGDDPAAAPDRRAALPAARARSRRWRSSSRSWPCPGTAREARGHRGAGVVNAGWYPVLQARLYDALGGASGLVLTVGTLVPLYAVLPIAVAAIAERWGLAAALWPLLAAPVALLLLAPRRSRHSRRARRARRAPRTPALNGRGRPLRPLATDATSRPKSSASALQLETLRQACDVARRPCADRSQRARASPGTPRRPRGRRPPGGSA